ncbi:hypothetical protein CVT24_011975 [Panaeolus cyanescens]|uniref:Cytochrome P450 n=1 Tax=Panaeolus cyanescens TaxID=181874 RepID=A0A409VZ24_9AGAR|nr:hypothetical protein CVT24_011975 [Panaeolus cyanescens]
MLNPVFSIAHMRQMMPIFYNIVHKLESSIAKQIQDGPKEIDMLSWMGRTALELIGQSGFGHSFDDLAGEDYDESSYSVALKEIVPTTFKLRFALSLVLPYVVNIGNPAFLRKAIDWIPIASVKKVRDLADVLHQTSIEIYQRKKKALAEGDQSVAEQIAQGKDILSILMKANLEASEEDRLPDEEIYSQISTFTFAGTDTTSNALARVLWLLAHHKDVQYKLRVELREAMEKAGGDIPYDELVLLPYMDAICRETMRLYSPVIRLTRMATEDVILPVSRPIRGVDGTLMPEVHVPKGTNVHVSLLAANRNKEIWGEDANEWRPERWLEPMMTFSAGGRSCIGFKFSQLEMKAVLSLLISRFEFSPSQEIFWQMTNIITPVIKNTKGGSPGGTPQLPLLVQLAA